MNQRILPILLALVTAQAVLGQDRPAKALPNPFYAMDTAFRRPGLSTEQQIDVLKELGYAGIAWTEEAPAQVKKVADQARKRGLKMFTIYCRADVTKDGEVKVSPRLDLLMDELKEHGTLIWIYLIGPGPKIDTLTARSPAVRKLRDLADAAAKRKLKVAIYPHAGFWVADTATALRLTKLVERKNFGISFNLIHSLWAGEEKEVPKLLEQAKPLLFAVTINGAEKTRRPGFRTPILTLDRGDYDVGIVLRKLHEMGYKGPIGFQGYGIKGDTRSILKPTMQAWRKLSAAAAK
jgi:sugar phosphate isomerase/epimerase